MFAKFFKYFWGTNWLKTLRINFHYFGFRDAVRLPIIDSKGVTFQTMEGRVFLESKPATGMFLLGFPYLGFQGSCCENTVWEVSGVITLRGNKMRIGMGAKFCVHGECILGDIFTIIGKSTIICNNKIVFGDNVLISWDVLLMDTDWHKVYNDRKELLNGDKPIIVGDNVWIGCRSTILKGSIIPSNSVIAACSIISGVLNEEHCIYSTNRKILRDNVFCER